MYPRLGGDVKPDGPLGGVSLRILCNELAGGVRGLDIPGFSDL